MELSFKSMLPEEQNYSYRQSQQLAMQTGFIGSMIGDLNRAEWKDFRKTLDTDQFQSELQDVGEMLRSDILKDPTAYCKAHPEAMFTDHNGTAFGFRADTVEYTYLLRLDPKNADNSVTIFCHKSDRHIEKAKEGIRFIDSSYNNKFRIADGDKIALTMGYDGEKLEKTCRFIDEVHLEVGTGGNANFFHICEFAERMENVGNTYVPLVTEKEKPSVTKQLAKAKSTQPPKPKDKAIKADKEVR